MSRNQAIVEVSELGKDFGSSGPSTPSTSRSTRARSSASSAPTAPARARPSTCSRPCSGRPAAGPSSAGYDVVTQPDGVRQSIGMVFQDPSLDDRLTADENLRFHAMLYNVPRRVREGRTEQVLHIVGLADRRHALVRTFSGGMKRRLEIARGLMHHPRVLFLDEPTVGLDPQTRNAIWEHVRACARRSASPSS